MQRSCKAQRTHAQVVEGNNGGRYIGDEEEEEDGNDVGKKMEMEMKMKMKMKVRETRYGVNGYTYRVSRRLFLIQRSHS